MSGKEKEKDHINNRREMPHNNNTFLESPSPKYTHQKEKKSRFKAIIKNILKLTVVL